MKKHYWNNALGINFFHRQKTSLRTDFDTAEQTPIASEQDTTRFRSFTLRSVFASREPARHWQWMAGLDSRPAGKRRRDARQAQLVQQLLDDALLIA